MRFPRRAERAPSGHSVRVALASRPHSDSTGGLVSRAPVPALVVAILVLLGGCGGDERESSADASSDTDAPAEADDVPRFIGPGECDDNASCAAGFTLDGTFYAISCGPIRPDVVTDDVLARGVYAGRTTEVRRIDGVDPHRLAAIQLDGGACGEGDAVLSEWSMVFPEGSGEPSETRDAICRVTFEEHLARNQCAEPTPYLPVRLLVCRWSGSTSSPERVATVGGSRGSGVTLVAAPRFVRCLSTGSRDPPKTGTPRSGG